MKMHARFNSSVALVALAAFASSLAACKKPEVPTPTPEPKAAQTEVTQANSGTTTTYAPPAPEPQAPPANAAQ